MDWSPLGSSVHRILQTRLQEWVAISFSKGSSQPGDHLILWADSLLSALKTGKMLHEAFIFKKLFILYWSTVSQQCCDSFRWTTKGLGHTHVHVSIPPYRPGDHGARSRALCRTAGPYCLSILIERCVPVHAKRPSCPSPQSPHPRHQKCFLFFFSVL